MTRMSAHTESALLGREPQSTGAQPANEFTAVDLDRTGGDHGMAVALGDVVVVALERPAWDAMARDEGMEFIE